MKYFKANIVAICHTELMSYFYYKRQLDQIQFNFA